MSRPTPLTLVAGVVSKDGKIALSWQKLKKFSSKVLLSKQVAETFVYEPQVCPGDTLLGRFIETEFP